MTKLTPAVRTFPRETLLTWAGLTLLVLIGLALRLPHMTRGLWFDEIFTASQVTFDRSFSTIVEYLKDNDPHPPLHYLGMRVYATLTGLHAWPTLSEGIEWKLRLPSLLMGLATIPVAFVAGRHFNPWSGWAAALAVTVSPLTVGESVEARMYASLTLLTVVSWALIFRGTPRALLAASILNVLGIWQQLIYGVVLVAQLLYLVTVRRAPKEDRAGSQTATLFAERPPLNWKQVLLVLGPSATILLWLPVIYQLFQVSGTNAAVRSSPQSVATYLFDALTGTSNLGNALVFGLVVAGLLQALKRNAIIPFFAVTLGIPFIWLLGSMVINISSMRYAGFTVPGFAIVVGAGIHAAAQWVLERSRRADPLQARTTALAGLTAAALLGMYAATQLSMDPKMRVLREPWREFAAYMAPRMQDGDVVSTLEAGRQMSILYYLRTPAQFENVHGGGDTVELFNEHRTWLNPDSFRTPVRDFERFNAWWDEVLANGRAKPVMTDVFTLYLVEPETGASTPDPPNWNRSNSSR